MRVCGPAAGLVSSELMLCFQCQQCTLFLATVGNRINEQTIDGQGDAALGVYKLRPQHGGHTPGARHIPLHHQQALDSGLLLLSRKTLMQSNIVSSRILSSFLSASTHPPKVTASCSGYWLRSCTVGVITVALWIGGPQRVLVTFSSHLEGNSIHSHLLIFALENLMNTLRYGYYSRSNFILKEQDITSTLSLMGYLCVCVCLLCYQGGLARHFNEARGPFHSVTPARCALDAENEIQFTNW